MEIVINNNKYIMNFYFDKRLYNTVIFQKEKQVIKEKLFSWIFKHIDDDKNLTYEQKGVNWYTDKEYSILFILKKTYNTLDILVGDIWYIQTDNLDINITENIY